MSARAALPVACQPCRGRELVAPAPRVAATIAFGQAAGVYWTSVFPLVCRELRHWRARALAIPDPTLREQALAALAKRGNMEGAAAFATFAPRSRRPAVVRATVAFQTAYNHLDVLSENVAAPDEQARLLHGALLAALGGDARAPHDCCSGRQGASADGGYLDALVETCRVALASLPGARVARSAALRAAERVVEFQVHQACGRSLVADERAVERFGRSLAPAAAGLRWWEAVAASGSSLGVHAMIAAAAEDGCVPERIQALEQAYFPAIGALHTLLDHLIDAEEDRACRQRNLLGYYSCAQETAERMGLLAARALGVARELGPGVRHELILTAMASFYLAAPQAREAGQAQAAQAVRERLGWLGRLAEGVFAVHRAA